MSPRYFDRTTGVGSLTESSRSSSTSSKSLRPSNGKASSKEDFLNRFKGLDLSGVESREHIDRFRLRRLFEPSSGFSSASKSRTESAFGSLLLPTRYRRFPPEPVMSPKAFLPLSPICLLNDCVFRGAKNRLKERGVTVGFALGFVIIGGGEEGIVWVG